MEKKIHKVLEDKIFKGEFDKKLSLEIFVEESLKINKRMFNCNCFYPQASDLKFKLLSLLIKLK